MASEQTVVVTAKKAATTWTCDEGDEGDEEGSKRLPCLGSGVGDAFTNKVRGPTRPHMNKASPILPVRTRDPFGFALSLNQNAVPSTGGVREKSSRRRIAIRSWFPPFRLEARPEAVWSCCPFTARLDLFTMQFLRPCSHHLSTRRDR